MRTVQSAKYFRFAARRRNALDTDPLISLKTGINVYRLHALNTLMDCVLCPEVLRIYKFMAQGFARVYEDPVFASSKALDLFDIIKTSLFV